MLQQVDHTGKFFKKNVHLTDLIGKTLTAMGYELMEVKCAPAGLLHVHIGQAENGVVIEDCKKVSHQLTRMFEVENVNYRRLEVSSPEPGRPPRTLADFTRFTDLEIKVTLRLSVSGQKDFTGIIQAPTGGSGQERIGLGFEDKGGPVLLEFALSELDRARLVPVLDFKGNRNEGGKR